MLEAEPNDDAPPECIVPVGCVWPIVLGVDPGTHACGLGVVVAAPDRPRLLACTVVRPGRRLPIAQRLERVRAGVEAMIRRCRPTAVAIERAFTARNVQSALRIGEGRGVVLACAARFGVDVVEYAPAAAKKSIAGNGNASKEQVARMVAVLLDRDDLVLAHDATDALALALAHVQRLRDPTRAASPATPSAGARRPRSARGPR